MGSGLPSLLGLLPAECKQALSTALPGRELGGPAEFWMPSGNPQLVAINLIDTWFFVDTKDFRQLTRRRPDARTQGYRLLGRINAEFPETPNPMR